MMMISSEILCISVVIWCISSLIMLYILDIIINRSIFPFYKFQTDDVSARLAKERYFIDVFSPKLNMF